MQAYTTASDSVWNVVNYTKRQQNGVEIVTLKVYSEYSKPLPGDLAITFNLAESTVKNATFWLLMLPLLIVLLLSPIVYRQLKQRKIRRATRIRNELLLCVAFLA
jgi:type II secretory pathway component PulL